jgi:hypothetical protein
MRSTSKRPQLLLGRHVSRADGEPAIGVAESRAGVPPATFLGGEAGSRGRLALNLFRADAHADSARAGRRFRAGGSSSFRVESSVARMLALKPLNELRDVRIGPGKKTLTM